MPNRLPWDGLSNENRDWVGLTMLIEKGVGHPLFPYDRVFRHWLRFAHVQNLVEFDAVLAALLPSTPPPMRRGSSSTSFEPPISLSADAFIAARILENYEQDDETDAATGKSRVPEKSPGSLSRFLKMDYSRIYPPTTLHF